MSMLISIKAQFLTTFAEIALQTIANSLGLTGNWNY